MPRWTYRRFVPGQTFTQTPYTEGRNPAAVANSDRAKPIGNYVHRMLRFSLATAQGKGDDLLKPVSP